MLLWSDIPSKCVKMHTTLLTFFVCVSYITVLCLVGYHSDCWCVSTGVMLRVPP